MGERSVRGWVWAAGLLAVGVLVGVVMTTGLDWSARTEARPGFQLEQSHAGDLPSIFVDVVEKVSPGVVQVDTKRTVEVSPFRFEGPFGQMFREMFPDMPTERQRVPGYGSGFVLTQEGYIMTNNHVVQNADRVEVKTSEGQVYRAEVVGRDPSTDVAVVRVSTSDPLHPIRLGDSDQMRVGDWVLAFGNPFGQLEGSVTAGVVSAKGRTDLAIAGGGPVYQDFIQTDASINFGNSGGPLVNLNGEVIGMNTAINPTGQGIGFAIPMNLAKRVAEQLIDQGKVVRGYMGILPQELTPELAEGKGLEGQSGILVAQVVEDSPAETAGLEVGDVIVEYEGEPVADVNRFRWLVADTEVGERARLKVLRDGRERKVEVVLTERPDVAVAAVEPEEQTWLGLEVASVRSPEAERLGVDPDERGVVVIAVEDASPAEDAGLRPGDLLVEVGGESIRDLDDFYQVRERLQDREKAIVFLIKRSGYTSFVAVKPESD